MLTNCLAACDVTVSDKSPYSCQFLREAASPKDGHKSTDYGCCHMSSAKATIRQISRKDVYS